MRSLSSGLLLIPWVALTLLAIGQTPAPDIDHPLHVCGYPDAPKDGPCATAPKSLTYAEPEYTDKARRAKLQGKILLDIVIDSEGHVARAKVVQGLGMGLDESSVKTVRKWTFKPGTYEGKPVPVTVPVEVTFHLR